jgi:uncharacterized protein (TIGR02246 family)
MDARQCDRHSFLLSRRTAMRRGLLMTIGAAAIISPVLTGNAESLSSREDEETIKKVIVEMTEGFNKHDAKAATRMYMPDADFVSVRGESAKGAAEVEEKLAAILATRAKAAALETLNVKIRFIKPDVALAYVTNELSGLVSPTGQNLPAHKELSLRVFVKENDGVWRVAAFQNTMLAPFESSVPRRD